MKTVNFTQMKDGTKDEYLLLDEYEQEYVNGTADRILNFMKGLTSFICVKLTVFIFNYLMLSLIEIIVLPYYHQVHQLV